jgi:hypothetical protein
MRMLGCVTFILPLFALGISQVASAPILSRRMPTKLEVRSNEEISGILERRNASPDCFASPISALSSRPSTRRRMFRRHITSHDKGLLRRSIRMVNSGLEKRTAATHLERRWWLFDKIKQGFQVSNLCSCAFCNAWLIHYAELRQKDQRRLPESG